MSETIAANAALVAAAPDLLAAASRLLKYAVDLKGSYHVHYSEIETLRAAVAKATVLDEATS